MERSGTRRGYPLRNAAVVLLLVLLAVYIPLRLHMSRQRRSGEAPAPGTALSIFFTSGLEGFREPCG